MRFGCPFQLTFPVRLRLRATFVSQNQPPSQLHFSFSARRVPTWFRWRESGRRAESESGGDGLLANPRIVARRRFQPFGRRHRNRSGGFCCFSPSKSREKSFPELYAESSRGFRKIAVFTNFFFLYFWGQKYQKPPHVVFRGSVRSAALHGARKIRPMRHPVADAPQLAPSFSASNESADWWCRRWRQSKYVPATCALFFTPQGDSRLGSDGEKADGGLKATAAGTVCLQTRAVARRRFQASGRRHRNRSGGFCCFSPPKSREKRVFPEAAKGLREVFCCFSPLKSREKSFSELNVREIFGKSHPAAGCSQYVPT